MCGIAGILRVHAPGAAPPPPEVSIPEAWLDTLDESIKHRGPDGHGRFRDRATRADGSVVDVAFVHRRLAIIDPRDGQQPMVSERGRNEGEGLVAVVFNGCIYNHRELRRELERAGHRFQTDHSDTEVLVHGWREWGQEVFAHLDGMYAAAIWDQARARLALARDFAGEKPLYVMEPDPGEPAPAPMSDRNPTAYRVVFRGTANPLAAFASSPSALIRARRAMGLLVEIGNSGVPPWIQHGWHPDPPLTGLRQIPPGSWRFTDRTETHPLFIERTRRLPERNRRTSLDVFRLDQLLDDAVRSCLEADVPMGCFLSGGVDSSVVAHFAKRALGSLRTFSVRMPDPRLDESAYARRVADLIGSEHETLDVEPNPAEDLVSLIQRSGLPFGDSSLLPTYWVSRAARRHVAVAIGGDGGDELFGGYERHRAKRVLERWGWLIRGISVVSGRRDDRSRAARLISAAAGNGYPDLVSIFPSADAAELFECPPGARLTPWFPDQPDALRWDFENYLPNDLLRKVDTAAMHVALEVRAPLLSRSLIQAALSVPLSNLMPRGQRKGLLRQVARRYLPTEIVDRPKQGFAIPIGEWFRSDYGGMKQLLMDHLNSTEPWGPPSLGIDLNMKFVRRMLDEHMSEKRDHSQRLYMLLVLSIWAKWLGSL